MSISAVTLIDREVIRVKKLLEKIRIEIENAPYKHPYFPLGISIIALIASIAMPLLRTFLAGKI